MLLQSTHGYIEVKLEQDPPIFSKVRINFNPSDKITHVAVANNYLVLAMANNVLFRIDLTHPEKHEGKDSCLLVLNMLV